MGRENLTLLAGNLALKLVGDTVRHGPGGYVKLAGDEAETAAAALEQHIIDKQREPNVTVGLCP
eukprot:4214899-Pyramimonas_sp.AAC.1